MQTSINTFFQIEVGFKFFKKLISFRRLKKTKPNQKKGKINKKKEVKKKEVIMTMICFLCVF